MLGSVAPEEIGSTEETGEIEYLGNRDEQINSLYMSTNYSDISFIVEDKKIPAHRYILAARSEYFHSLLYGSFAEADQTEIEIKVPIDAFKIILGYIYTGRLSLSKISSIEILNDVVELGNVYNFPELQSPCEKYFKQIISLNNVCLILDVTKNLNFYALQKECLYFIDKNSDYIITHKSIQNTSKEVLIEILKRDSFYTKEIKIFHAVNDWCKKNDSKIEDLIYLVRLPLIPYDELVNDVWKSTTLSSEKILSTLLEQTSAKLWKARGFLIKDENVASIKFNAQTIRGNMEYALLNGDIESYKTANGYTRHLIANINDSAIIVELGFNCIINHIKLLLWDRDERSYSYFIDVSIDQKNWERIIDYSRFMCRSWQNLYFSPRPIKYIKIVGTHCSGNNYFDVVSLEAYYIENSPEVKNSVVVPKNNVSLYKMGACVIEGCGTPNQNNIIDGDFLNQNGHTYHTIAATSKIIIRLSQPYYLGSLRLLIYGETAHGLYIETSINNKEWERVVDKSQERLKSWQCFTFSLKPVVFIKLVGTSPQQHKFCVVHIECPSSIDN